jgi:glycosyltransferase involved in cell wall biosynthesis
MASLVQVSGHLARSGGRTSRGLRLCVSTARIESSVTHPMNKSVRILGTHGVPAAYGGFETAAEHVATYLVGRGWRVVVYCQLPGRGPIRTDSWEGIERVLVPIPTKGWLGTSRFDLVTVRHATRHRDLCLTFGYNTAIFNTWQRAKGIPNVINMDGIEWSRERWGRFRQGILLANERVGLLVGDHLIADHPEIETYLKRHAPARKISMVTYGAHTIIDAPTEPVVERGLEPCRYLTLIARPIPENSILELVEGFSARPRSVRLAVVGDFDDGDPYARSVRARASDEVRFLGGIYQPEVLQALRFHCLGYLHGHTVGGTNPSLVEALAAGNPVIAHDNPYNRWTAADAALWFRDAGDADARITELLARPALRDRLTEAARRRHAAEFTWDHVGGQYEDLLLRYLPQPGRRRGRREERR